MIRRAKRSEIKKILSITRACAAKMIAEDIFQWNEGYPSREAFLKDLDRNELYVYVKDHELIGCMAVSTVKHPAYKDIEWLLPDGINYYVHRLAIHPEYQGKGYARRLMDFSEAMALRDKVESIRLDTFSKNRRNQLFYEQRGYERLGEVYFPEQSRDPFYCYELLLSKP